MAQHTLEPAPTKAELRDIARLVLEHKKSLGYRTNRETAEAIGLQESELSRLLNARVERHWGFSRIARIASWLGMTVDGVLGRAEGETKLMLAGGVRPHRVPVMRADRVVVSRDEVAQIARETAAAHTRLRMAVGDQVGPDKAEAVARLVDEYIDRMWELQKGLGL